MGFAQFDAAKVGTMSDSRKSYFEGIGVDISKATSLDTALNLSGLNFEVIKKPMAFIDEQVEKVINEDGTESEIITQVTIPYPNQYVTVRKDTNQPLGPVGKNYEILQNSESFDFLDSLVSEGDAQFVNAGLYGGAKSFIMIKTDNIQILNDSVAPYILLMNSFDGSGAVMCMFTPIRCFCSNCLARALRESTNKTSIRHSSSLQSRLDSARAMLKDNNKYMDALKDEAEILAKKHFTIEQFNALVNELYPINEEDSDVIKERATAQRGHLLKAYNAPDLANFNNTAWKALQAVADADSHALSFRASKTENLRAMKNVIDGMKLTNLVANRLLEAV